MKQLSYGISWICIVLLICMAYYGSYEISMQRQKEKAGSEAGNRTQTVTGAGENAYVLKEEDGIVLVYQSDGTTLYEKTDIDFYGLPQEVQQEITSGMRLESSASLYSFLENYSS